MKTKEKMCRCGREGAPTKAVQFRVPGKAHDFKKEIIRLCAKCRKGRANIGRFRIVEGW